MQAQPRKNRLSYIVLGMVCVLVFLGQFKETKSGEQAVLLATAREKIIVEAKANFQRDPGKVKSEIAGLIEKKDFAAAKRKTERLLDMGDPDIQRLYETATAANDRLIQDEQEKIQKATQESQGVTLQALDKCKLEIASFLDASGAGAIPDVQNYGSGNEFVFGWTRGMFRITTVFGTVDLSASCDGILKPLKIESLSINGRTIILGGKNVFRRKR